MVGAEGAIDIRWRERVPISSRLPERRPAEAFGTVVLERMLGLALRAELKGRCMRMASNGGYASRAAEDLSSQEPGG